MSLITAERTDQPFDFDPRDFRRTLGRFATGVTVVSYELDGACFGATVNSFTSVSIDPPLVLVSLATGSRAAPALPDRPYDIHQNVIAMGVTGAVDRSDVPDEAFEGWGCALMPSFICGDSKETRAAEGKKRRAMLEGMWMALWPEVDIMVRRLKTKDLSCA